MYSDLLDQAKSLATLDAKKPKQANLRRAISSTYYALFHFLVEEECRLIIGTQHGQLPYRQVLGRAFEHQTMKEACGSFSGGTLKAAVAKGLPPQFTILGPIKSIARTFVDLQEKRHLADYDRTERFLRSDVLTLVEQVESVIEEFSALAATNEKKFFLACLLAWKSLARR